MRSQFVAKKLVRYRNWTVAIANAVITWIILIIAPLGLFAVIICTLAVFLSSLMVGWGCDRALFQLLGQNQRDIISNRRESEGINFASQSYLDLLNQEQKKQR